MPDDVPTQINLELIQGLLLEAGRIMEDVSAEMALVLPNDPESVVDRVEALQHAADAIMALAGAAKALSREVR